MSTNEANLAKTEWDLHRPQRVTDSTALKGLP